MSADDVLGAVRSVQRQLQLQLHHQDLNALAHETSQLLPLIDEYQRLSIIRSYLVCVVELRRRVTAVEDALSVLQSFTAKDDDAATTALFASLRDLLISQQSYSSILNPTRDVDSTGASSLGLWVEESIQALVLRTRELMKECVLSLYIIYIT